MSYVPTKWFCKNNMAYVKMIKFGTKISLFATLFFVYFAQPIKDIHFWLFFTNLCTSI
jgi:hypothetical protein